MALSRRELLQSGAVAATLPLLDPIRAIGGLKPKLRFVHFTDMHIQPELGATEGVKRAVDAVLKLSPRPDFVITGGDHVMDLLKASHKRADVQFEELKEAMKPIEMPIHGVIGNHDVYGWGLRDANHSDVEYGKRMLEDRFLKAPAYRSFDIGGWHFVLLDGVQPEEKIGWRGAIDEVQLAWLENDLAQSKGHPTLLISHFPVLTLFTQYTDGTTVAPTDTLLLGNGREVQQLCQRFGVKAVLQGHTHVVEDCSYLGTRYITGGAVCGDWWKGWRLGVHPEGFMVYDLDASDFRASYHTYGWKASEHQADSK